MNELTKKTSSQIPLTRPYIDQSAKNAINSVLESGYLTEGGMTAIFEERVSSFVGASFGVACSSCTTGLEASMRVLGIGNGDEVIVPDFTYPATGLAVLTVGASPVLVDTDPQTLLMDLDAAERAVTDKTKAIVPVPIFGNPLNYQKFRQFCDKHGLFFIEDAATGIGASWKQIKVGSGADLSIFSFHPRKIITTGEGGMVTTDNPEWATLIRSHKRFGSEPVPGENLPTFKRDGTNFKMSDVLAAIGVSQMNIVDTLLEKRRSLALRYNELLGAIDGVKIPETTIDGVHAYQSYCIIVENRDAIIAHMKAAGIETQIGTFSLHREPVFAKSPRVRIPELPSNSLKSFNQTLALPLFYEMANDEQEQVVESLKRAIVACAGS